MFNSIMPMYARPGISRKSGLVVRRDAMYDSIGSNPAPASFDWYSDTCIAFIIQSS